MSTNDLNATDLSATEVTIAVNGDRRSILPGTTVRELIAELIGREISAEGRALDAKTLGVAVAQNSRVVPRSLWHSTELGAGDTLEIITAVQGG